MINIKPIHDNIIIKIEKVKKEEVTSSGIILTNAGKSEQVLRKGQGEVIATGEGRYFNNGTKLPVSVKKGQKVLFNKFAGTTIDADEEDAEYLIVKESDIIAILD